MNQTEIDELRRLHEADSAKIINAMANIDWQQHLMNAGGCFHVEDDGRLCGRADRWSGHGEPDFHMFVPLYVAATKLAKGNAIPRLLAALEEARAERDNALHSMRVAEQCAGMANAAKDKSMARENTMFSELRKMLGQDLGGGGGFIEILNGIEGLQEERDALKAKLAAMDLLLNNAERVVRDGIADRDAAETQAWDALGRPEGTHDTTNVQRLCEAHGALKAKLAEARAERLGYRAEYLELLRRIREGQLVTATEASMRYEGIIAASSEEPL